jgi:peptide/nickel transport system substrate-binding protein
MADGRVRQAMNYAIDKDALIKIVTFDVAKPMTSFMSSSTPYVNAKGAAFPFDQAKAKALLGEAGWQPGGDGIRARGGQRLEIVLNAIEYGGGADPTAQIFQASLNEVGIDVKIKAQARPPWYEDNYHCASNGMTLFLRSGELDALYALYHSSNVGGNFNWSCIKDPEVDKALEQGRQESDTAKRKQVYLQLEQKLMDMAVVVPLVDQLSVFAMKPNVSGLKFTGNSYPLLTDVAIK